VTDKPKDGALGAHLRMKHPAKTLKAHEQATMDPNLVPESLPERAPTLAEAKEMAGLSEINELDKFDILFVEEGIRRECDTEGASLRWSSPEKAEYWKQQGGEVVHLKKEGRDRSLRPDTEDGTTRTRELVLLKFPQQARSIFQSRRQKKTDDQLSSRLEDVQKKRSKMAQVVYDAALREGHDRNQAMNVADSIERGSKGAGENMGHIRVTRG
tara:strand:- start:19 stop:657 length:639 start_codon:yes stop_codon:yes gene_type:complete